jgi:hypothetical protein
MLAMITDGIAAAAGLDPIRIQAALELGRRRGRSDAVAKVRGLAPLCRLMEEEPPSAA